MADADAKAQEEWASTMKKISEADLEDKELEDLPKATKVDVVVGSEEETLLTEAVLATVTRQFPDLVKNDPDVKWLSLVFLRFRGYAVVDAVARLGRFLEFRSKYGLQNQKTLSAVNKEMLLDGTRVALPGTDKEGHGLMLMYLRNNKAYDPKLVMQVIHWLIITMLRKGGAEVQKKGMTAIMDMEGASFKNFDVGLMKEMRPAMAKCFPLRMTQCYIINPNSLVDVIVPVFRAFNEKMGGRIQVVRDLAEIHQHVDKAQLPPSLGGTLNFDFKKWVEENC
jgi:hypothetical protein